MLPCIDISNHKSLSKLYLEYDLLGEEFIFKQDADAMSLHNENKKDSPEFVNVDYIKAVKGSVNNKLL